MSLKFEEIKAILHEVTPLIKNATLVDCEEINKDIFILNFCKNEETHKVLLCFKTPFVRIHTTERSGIQPKSPLQRNLKNLLLKAKLTHIDLINDDRILELTFQKKDKFYTLIAELFSKFANSYLLNVDKEILYSIHPTNKKLYSLPEKTGNYTHTTTSAIKSVEVETRYNEKEKEYFFKQAKNSIFGYIGKRIKSKDKKIAFTQKKLSDCKEWEQVHHTAQLLQSNLFKIQKHMTEVEVDDWNTGKVTSIALDPTISPPEQVKVLFKKSKKLKKGISHTEHQIEKLKKEKLWWLSRRDEIEPLNSIKDIEKYCKEHHIKLPDNKPTKTKNVLPAKHLPYRVFTSKSGKSILVGKGASDNELLTFHHANGSDLWLHVDGWPGSHVVIKKTKNEKVDDSTIWEACQLAIGFSKAKGHGSADVIITQQKFLKRIKGAAKGKVNMSEHSTKHIEFDSEAFKKIKSRNKDQLA
ncbi:MAG: NFACT RNA binding domain-containing protein [Chlamydiota bacterium]|nr:NFACT RNA binding domain-containing protein [Chlamydiota bacterium]